MDREGGIAKAKEAARRGASERAAERLPGTVGERGEAQRGESSGASDAVGNGGEAGRGGSR